MLKQTVLFEDILCKPVQAQFSDERLTSDAGSLLIIVADKKLGLTESIAELIPDGREPAKVQHEVSELLKQRVFGIANGYEDGNDAAKMKGDPLLKMACGRRPIKDRDLASQPTLSRFENSVGPRALVQISKTLARKVLAYHKSRRSGKKKPKLITVDMDPYCDPTHGAQQLTFFNGFYDTTCYLPQTVTLCFDAESVQYAIGVVLRPGDKGAQYAVIPMMKRLVPLMRKAFPEAKIRFRADANFSGPDLLKYLEKEQLGYFIGIGANSVLQRYAEEPMKQAQELYELQGETVTCYGEHPYRAGTWDTTRRVVFKAEMVEAAGREPKMNNRTIVTNLAYTPRRTFKRYHLRGDMENRIKELKRGLLIDRTSCCAFMANQFRVLMTLAAFVLYQVLQDKLGAGELAHAQVSTVRERLFKVAARVKESARRVVLYLTANYPWKDDWIKIAKALGAMT